MPSNATLIALHRPANRRMGLAAVARERAGGVRQGAAAPDTPAAGPHLEQQAYLVRLAEVYDGRARGG